MKCRLWGLSGVIAVVLMAVLLRPIYTFAQSADAYFGQGVILYAKRDLKGALAAFSKTIQFLGADSGLDPFLQIDQGHRHDTTGLTDLFYFLR